MTVSEHKIISAEIASIENRASVRCTVECACGHESRSKRAGTGYQSVIVAERDARTLHAEHTRG